ncbi:MAG: C40 family peptidase [Pseudomonadota bacterium]|jgi:cell wall-associated NlpC family hydrolase
MRKTLTAILIALCTATTPAQADETAAQLPDSLMSRAVGNVESTLDRAFNYIGVRYKRGGSSPETGFDCSGFVKYLYDETLGLVLPHNAKAIAQQGERVEKSELQPGDLVFFNTMRRAFSHVGIYLGDNQFIHAPRTGTRVRIEDMSDRYWSRRFNGARRIQP